MSPPVFPEIVATIRRSKSALLQTEGELERLVEVAGRRAGRRGGILILIDSDGDCPSVVAESMLRRASAARPDLPIAVVLAKRELEAWFIAAAKSLQGKSGMVDQIELPADPVAINDAKGWIKMHMKTRRYSETVDQVKLTIEFDLDEAQACRSFRKLYKEVTQMLTRRYLAD